MAKTPTKTKQTPAKKPAAAPVNGVAKDGKAKAAVSAKPNGVSHQSPGISGQEKMSQALVPDAAYFHGRLLDRTGDFVQ